MTLFRRHQIRFNIAQVLDHCEPMLVPETRLRDEVNLQLRPAATLLEFDQVIALMEVSHHILRHRNDENIVKTKLTEEGRAELLR
jgi:hypothetical protein